MLHAVLALLVSSASPPTADAGRVIDRVAGVVNGDVITLRELEDRAGSELKRVDAMAPGPDRDKARASALKSAFDSLVAEHLFAAQVTALGVEVTDPEIDSVIADVKRRNGLDDERLNQALAAQGMDWVSYRKAVKRDLESMRLVQLKIRSKVKVTDEDVRNYWQTHPQEFRAGEEVRARLIFFPLPAEAGEAGAARMQAEAEQALARLRAGEDFGLVARQVSQGPSASEGGELGWLRRGTVQAAIEKVIFALQPGQYSQPIRTSSGIQILQVEERRGGGVRPLEQVTEEIRDRLVNEQGDAYRAQYIADLRRDASIETLLPELKE
jgi:peptidyl-prolyl cis-trans isomerase SurA